TARGEVRRGQADRVADRSQPFLVPLGRDDLAVRPVEPDEAALDAERAAGLLDRDSLQRVEVELGPHAASDLRDEPLALDGVRERLGRPRAFERERGLRDERAKRPELVDPERTTLGR